MKRWASLGVLPMRLNTYTKAPLSFKDRDYMVLRLFNVLIASGSVENKCIVT